MSRRRHIVSALSDAKMLGHGPLDVAEVADVPVRREQEPEDAPRGAATLLLDEITRAGVAGEDREADANGDCARQREETRLEALLDRLGCEYRGEPGLIRRFFRGVVIEALLYSPRSADRAHLSARPRSGRLVASARRRIVLGFERRRSAPLARAQVLRLRGCVLVQPVENAPRPLVRHAGLLGLLVRRAVRGLGLSL